MKVLGFAIGLLTTLSITVSATVRYVDVNNFTPSPPFTNWTTAAAVIQDAIDLADPGDQILVTNGVYKTGGRIVDEAMTNRVAVTVPVTVQSVNGPAVTIIEGHQVPGSLVGDAAVRCVYLVDGATLIGFTLTNGASLLISEDLPYRKSGGGILGLSTNAMAFNCVIVSNAAYNYGGGAFGVALSNCTIIGNNGFHGAGVSDCVLVNCTLTGNSTDLDGGGAYNSALIGCTLSGNSALNGGGANACTLTNCILSGNSAQFGGGANSSLLFSCLLTNNVGGLGGGGGGGANESTLNNCTLVNNNGGGHGGGANSSALNNCLLTGNGVSTSGGGANQSFLTNCTIFGNSSGESGGGVNGSTVNNCIVYGNSDNFYESTLNYCCTTPLPGDGLGNFTNEPALINAGSGDFHLQPSSPCINSGRNSYAATDTDLDGNPRISGGTVDVGAYEFLSLVRYVNLNSASPAPPYTNWATAATNIQDAIDVAVSGDRILVTNGVYQTGGRIVYGSMTNRIAITKVITVQSVNGPIETIIRGNQMPGVINGDQSVRCVYITNRAKLIGFTLRDGATRSAGDLAREQSGGGIWCETDTPSQISISNCVVMHNSAKKNGGGIYGGAIKNSVISQNSADRGGGTGGSHATFCLISSNTATHGGGTYVSMIDNCTLSQNMSASFGGGAAGGDLHNSLVVSNRSDRGGGFYSDSFTTLANCTIVGNSASQGGGVSGPALFVDNCIIYYNDATTNSNHEQKGCYYSCTTPLPPGSRNITNEPMFLDSANGDFHLQANSPCINAGRNSVIPPGFVFFVPPDLDGNPRNVGGTVDIGAYECQSPALLAYYTWLQTYSLPTDASAAYADSDGDLLNNWQEWKAGTNPTNNLSVLDMRSPTNDSSGMVVTWQSVTNKTYFLDRATDLAAQPSFSNVASNLVGQVGTTTYTDTNAVGDGPFFYRVGMQE